MHSPLRKPGPETVPVARPANPVVTGAADDEPAPAGPWLTREMVRGWASSVTVHALLLLGMAFWVLYPKSNPPRTIDSRLMGSESGVDEGMTLTGGLNTEFDLQATPEPPPQPALASFKPLALEALEPKLSAATGAAKTSAGGGLDNNNPGAGNGDGFGLAKFGQGGERIGGVEVKVGDPQFTLIWDTEVDLDLHVIEPGGKEIYWEEPHGEKGGELDVDNTKGFGPENVYWLRDVEGTGEKVKGPGPPGEYKWFVVYWGGFGGVPRPTRWKVRIKHAGKVTVVTGRFRALNERSKTHTLKVEAGPGPGVVATP